MSLIKIHIPPGQEVMETLTQYFSEHNLTAGAIVSVIGAVDACCISNMPKTDASADILNTYTQPFELSGNGEIRDGKPHLHCVLGQEGDHALSGHLHWATVSTWFVNVYILPIL